MKKKLLAALLAVVLCIVLFTGCETRTINVTYPENGSTVSLANEQVTEFWLNYEVTLSQQYSDGTDKYKMAGLDLTWENDNEADYYEVQISENKDMSDPLTYTALGQSLHVDDLMPNTTYYWQIKAIKGNEAVKSDIFNFKTENTCRTVYIDGVTNTRDFGGVKTKSGKTVKLGMVYRGAYIDNITTAGKITFTEVLGIKTDLDLRTPGEGKCADGNGSPAGENVNYINCNAPYYTHISEASYQEAMANEIRAFADESNYPIYFHCQIGRDRTGTLGYMLGAILGLSDDDLTREYEMSGFSKHGGDNMSGMVTVQLGSMITYLNKFEGKNTQQKVESYLKSIGVEESTFDAIRSIMLE